MTARVWRIRRYSALLAAVAAVVQLPAVVWLCVQTRSPAPVAAAAFLSAPYIARFKAPWQANRVGPVTWLALGWWSACLVFGVLLLPAYGLIRFGVPVLPVWCGAWTLALALALDALIPRARLRRRTVRIAELPAELEGFRVGQISDIHCGPEIPEHRVASWARCLNRLDLDLVTVTGDLITSGASHVEAVARALGTLKAKACAFVSLGNHDYFTDAEQLVHALEQNGLVVLRNRGLLVAPKLFLAGVDDTWSHRADLTKALAERPAGVSTILLAHDPDLFPSAANACVDLTLSGHTHGGQLGIPGMPRWSLARLMTRFSAGFFRLGKSWLYVNRGAGTTGPPARLGAPAELAVLTLRRAR